MVHFAQEMAVVVSTLGVIIQISLENREEGCFGYFFNRLLYI